MRYACIFHLCHCSAQQYATTSTESEEHKPGQNFCGDVHSGLEELLLYWHNPMQIPGEVLVPIQSGPGTQNDF